MGHHGDDRRHANRDPITAGWLSFGQIMIECATPKVKPALRVSIWQRLRRMVSLGETGRAAEVRHAPGLIGQREARSRRT